MRLPSGLYATLLRHRCRVALEGEGFLASRCVPYQQRAVPAFRDDAFAVRAEGHAADGLRVAPEGTDFLARRRVPDLHLARVPCVDSPPRKLPETMRLPSRL